MVTHNVPSEFVSIDLIDQEWSSKVINQRSSFVGGYIHEQLASQVEGEVSMIEAVEEVSDKHVSPKGCGRPRKFFFAEEIC